MHTKDRALPDAGTTRRRLYWFFGQLVTVHVTGEESGGRFSFVEFLMPPGHMTPLHAHVRDSQTVYVLDGELTIWLPGRSYALGPGECLYQAAGVPHTERVTSSYGARVLDINAPAGFDAFVVAAGEPASEAALPPPALQEPDLERLAALASEHEIELLGPPGELP